MNDDLIFNWDGNFDESSLICTDVTSAMICPCTALTITCENGKSLTIDYSDGKMHVECDADMNEAAEIFFNEALKGLVDNYIESNSA